jgi:serine/threonine protein kinase
MVYSGRARQNAGGHDRQPEGAAVHGLAASDPATIGRYRIVGVLGSGGMGRVLLGESRDGRLVAVKVVHPHLALTEDFRTRFRQEVAASRAVSGAYTAAVMDADPDAEAPWLASVFVPGPSLAEAVKANGPLPADSVLRLAAGLAAALAEIHRAGVIHRDLKPSNVLLADDGPRVIDFGIARAAETTNVTHTGSAIGSPAYMSPEQALGERVTPASDVFSLGSVLHLAATGHGPFGGDSAPQILYQVVHGAPDLSRVPPALVGLIGACLARDPAARPTPDDVLNQIPAGGGWPPPGVPALIETQRAQARELVTGVADATTRTPAMVTPNATHVAPVAELLPQYPPTPPPTAYPTPPPFPRQPPRRTPPWVIPAVVVALVIAIAVPVTLLLVNKDDTPDAGPGGPTTSASSEPSTDTTTDDPTESESESESETDDESESVPDGATVIGPRSLGLVELGMTVDEAVATGDMLPLGVEPAACTPYAMNDESGYQTGWLWLGNDGRIVIISAVEAVYTPEGITTGATLSDVSATYPGTATAAADDGTQFAQAPVPDDANTVYAMELDSGNSVVSIAVQDVYSPC